MSDTRGASGRRRPNKNVYTTKSGNQIKLNQSLSDRLRARKNARFEKKALYLSTLPKNYWKRTAYRLHPKRLAQYWFSREGGLMALKIAGVAIVVFFFLTVGVFAYFRKDLPKIKDLGGTDLGGSITYYDRTGQTILWQDYSGVKRVPVQGNEMSPYMRQATVAIEDKDFYKHGAFDTRGIIRAGVNNLVGSGGTQGGSSITQQLVKLNEQWTNQRTITRKVKELILAVELERQYTKEDILTGYLNVAPYGGVEYGVESAARDYFNVDAKNLTLAQSAMLASIPKAPTAYSPYSDPKYNPSASDNLFNAPALLARQHYVLDQMAKQHMITQDQADAAKKDDVLAQVHTLQSKFQGIKAPYFVLAAKQQLQHKYGEQTVNRGGWKVVTTLDMNLQNTAENLVAKNRSNAARYGADEEAMVAEDVQTGQIVSLVGGTDFSDPDHGQNNFASGIQLPPGSSFKPYDYATLIDNNNNVGAGSVLYDTQGAIPGYPCTNKQLPKDGGNCLTDYDFQYPGPVTLRYALGGSRNVPAVKAMLSAVPNDNSAGKVNSVNKVIHTATAMMDNPYVSGNTYNCYDDEALTQKAQCYGASAIGDGAYLHLDDHVNGLSTLGRMGNAIPRTYILKITDSANKVVDQYKQPKANQVIKPDTAYIVNDMASDPNASYLPASYKFQHQPNGWHFAVKTGTTNDGYDGLMTSWSTKYAVVSWVGNHTRHVTLRTSMETMTEPLTRGFMEAAHANLKPNNWTAPVGVKTMPAFIVRNKVSRLGESVPSPANDLFPSWYQGKTSSTSQTTDKVSGKLATSCTPAMAKSTITNGNVSSWNIDLWNGGNPSSGAGGSSGTASNATDDVHKCSDASPSVTLTASTTTCDSSNPCTFTVTASQGTHALSDPQYAQFPGTINLMVNGQVVSSATIPNDSSDVFTKTFSYTPKDSGTQTVTAQVIDSVLYSSTSDPTSITTDASGPLTIAPPSISGNTATISWSGGKPKYNIVVTGPNGYNANNANTTDTSFKANGLQSGRTYTATVTDSDGNSDSVSFKVQ